MHYEHINYEINIERKENDEWTVLTELNQNHFYLQYIV